MKAMHAIGEAGAVSLVRKEFERTLQLGSRVECRVMVDAVSTPEVSGRFCRLTFVDCAHRAVEEREIWVDFHDYRATIEDVFCLPPETVDFEVAWVEVLVDAVLGEFPIGWPTTWDSLGR